MALTSGEEYFPIGRSFFQPQSFRAMSSADQQQPGPSSSRTHPSAEAADADAGEHSQDTTPEADDPQGILSEEGLNPTLPRIGTHSGLTTGITQPVGPQISSEPPYSSLSNIPSLPSSSLSTNPLQHHPLSMFQDSGVNPVLPTPAFPPHPSVSMPQIPFPGGVGNPFFNPSLPFPPFFPQPSFPMTMPPYASDVVPDPAINPGGLYSSLQPQNELKCQICGREFARRTNLLLHYRTHTGEKPYSCDTCGRSFSQSGSLKAHKRIHTGEMPYQCSYCPKKFRLKGQKTRHERTHTGERPFVCDQCGAKFADTTNLQSHKRIHTGERPFVCEHCHKGFSQKQHLKTHLLTHTGELPHECGVCRKRFRQKGHLKQHERTHTGEKPFECQICGQRFTKSGNLNSHMRLHQWRCELCNLTFSDQASMRAHELQVHPTFESSSHM